MQVVNTVLNQEISTICDKIDQLNRELDLKRAQIITEDRKKTREGTTPFNAEVQQERRKSRTNVFAYLFNLPISAHISAPFVYAMIIPFSFMDLCVVVYQAICFRLWGIEPVIRGDHVVVDRQHLQYLNGVEKLNCVYCGYANGVVSFTREVAARTEQYWCPIKHAEKNQNPHSQYDNFKEYGDVDGWKNERKYPKIK